MFNKSLKYIYIIIFEIIILLFRPICSSLFLYLQCFWCCFLWTSLVFLIFGKLFRILKKIFYSIHSSRLFSLHLPCSIRRFSNGIAIISSNGKHPYGILAIGMLPQKQFMWLIYIDGIILLKIYQEDV